MSFASLPAAVMLLIMTVVVLSSGARTTRSSQVPIRSKEDVELNCPSIHHVFPPGTLRCESCRAIGEALTFLIERRSMDPLEALEDVCDGLKDNAVLQQTRSGLRYWDLSAMRTDEEEASDIFPFTSNIDKAERKGAKAPVTGPEGEPSDPYQVTYHTPEERVVLPCAHYSLKRYCESFIEQHDELIESCLATYRRSIKLGAVDDAIAESRPKRADPSRGGKKLNREVAADMLRLCLVSTVCEAHTNNCDSRIVAAAEEEEVSLFRKYQGQYSSRQFPYVPDRLDQKLYERNPYAKGGLKEDENELLKVPLEEHELL